MPDWVLRKIDDSFATALAGELGVHPITARCLAGRGIRDAKTARAYLDPKLGGLRPPAGLAGLAGTVDRLARAVRGSERIGLFGDYDVDGVTTCALMTHFLRALGVPCEPRVARRDAGYGFGEEDVRFFSERGCTLVVTGDCGTSDVASIALARTLGMDVVVIDHHTVPPQGPEVPPHPATALLNPFREDSTFPFRGMASVGLAFYTMAALRSRLQEDGFLGGGRPGPDLRDLTDLVAVGTIADLVPLTGENRILTRYGLGRLERRSRPGLEALLRLAGHTGKLDEHAVSWKIAPRLNAPGRLGDAGPALDLLLAANDREAEAAAERVERANEQRREAQKQVMEEAMEALEGRDPGPAVVVAGRGWASGVVGIVAAKLAERHRRPAIVIALDPQTGEGRGSARSFGGVHLYQVLARCQEVLVRFGGHAGAAGLTLAAGGVERFRELAWAAVEAELADRAAASSDLEVDAEVELADVDLSLAGELSSLAPFGRGNEEPLLASRARVQKSRRVGDGSHLLLHLEDAAGAARRAIAFGQGELDPGPGAFIDAAFVPGIDDWGGRRRVELKVRRFQPVLS